MKIKKNLKKILSVGTALAGLITAPLSINAQERDFHKIKNQPAYEYSIPLQRSYEKKALNDSLKETDSTKKDSNLEFLAKMGIGAIGGYGLHEAAHYIAGESLGVDVNFRLDNTVKIKYGKEMLDRNKSQQRLIHGSGIIAQTAGTEILFNSERDIKKNPYALGFVGFSILNNLVYALAPDLGGEDSSDIRSLEKTGVNGNLMRGALIAHSAYSIYRLLKKPNENKPSEDKKTNFYIAPLPEGGIEAKFEYRF
ncbi:MAG: hypothetical protein ABIH28_03285 [archaeon]